MKKIAIAVIAAVSGLAVRTGAVELNGLKAGDIVALTEDTQIALPAVGAKAMKVSPSAGVYGSRNGGDSGNYSWHNTTAAMRIREAFGYVTDLTPGLLASHASPQDMEWRRRSVQELLVGLNAEALDDLNGVVHQMQRQGALSELRMTLRRLTEQQRFLNIRENAFGLLQKVNLAADVAVPGYPGQYPGSYPVPQPGPSMQIMNFQSGIFHDPYAAEDSLNRAVDNLSSAGYSVIENHLNGLQYTLVFNAPAYTRIQLYSSGQYNDHYSAEAGLSQAVSVMEQEKKIIVETRMSSNMFYITYIDRTGPILPPVNPPAPPQQMCGGTNVFGTYYAGGGCNTFGCWKRGGGCSTFGCWERGGGCSTSGCWKQGGGCNTFGCWRAGGSCGAFGCTGEVPSHGAGSQPCRR